MPKNKKSSIPKPMKTLYLIRHAKSDWSNPILSDFDRPLNRRGEKNAPMMGQILSDQNILPDLILSSPARRAKTTARILADAIGYPRERIVYDEMLYLADPSAIANVLDNYDTAENIFVVGHNPGLTEFANNICPCNIDNIPTCGIVAVTFENDSETGKLLFFDYPKRHRRD